MCIFIQISILINTVVLIKLRINFVKSNNVYNFVFQNNPPDLSQCVFVIEQALSVRALQELMASGSDEAVSIVF